MEENTGLNKKEFIEQDITDNVSSNGHLNEKNISDEDITDIEYTTSDEDITDVEYRPSDEQVITDENNKDIVEKSDVFDEKKQMTDVIKSLKDLFRFVSALKDLRADKIDCLERLEKLIKAVPSSNNLAIDMDREVSKAKEFIELAKTVRAESFKRHEAEYIKSLHAENRPVREYSNGWRTGRLMIKVRPGLSKIKILYNEQTLINWTSVKSKEDFVDLENRANLMLDSHLIPEQDIAEVFFDAFKEAKNHLSGKGTSSLVPVFDFYREVRIALIRNLLANKGLTARIDKYHKFPIWAFLYNLDIYRSLGLKVPDNKRLGLQTGSMQEASQNKGFVVNGLNPCDEYKVMCYVIPVKRGSGK